MSKNLDTAQQRTSLFVLAGMTLALLFCLQISGSLSGLYLTAVAWFVGMSIVTYCALKAVIPLLADQRG